MTSSITMNFVGDICFADTTHSIGYGIRSLIRAGLGPLLLKHVASINSCSDLSICNLECVLSNAGEDPSKLDSIYMRGDPQSVDLLTSAGFSLANVANNHTMQHGLAAFSETVLLLKARGISVIGLKGSDSWCAQPLILTIKGKRIGILGYSYLHDRNYHQDLPYACGDYQMIGKDISRLKKQVDLVILTCHWGSEYIDHPSKDTITLARSFVSFGARLIIGHHPHVLQGIETYRNGIIAYSLGNLVFDMTWSKRLRSTMVLQVNYTNDDLQYSMIPFEAANDGTLQHPSRVDPIAFNTYMKSLKAKIDDEMGKPDAVALRGYERCTSMLLHVNRLLSYFHFFIGFGKYDKRFLLQQIKRTFSSRKEDFIKAIR